MIAEAEVVDLYLPGVCEELELSNVSYDVLPTRKHPGLSEEERLSSIYEGTVGLILAIGELLEHSKATRNFSVVYHSPGLSLEAERLSEALSEWGSLISLSHMVKKPVERSEWAGKAVLRAEPFCLNGPDAGEYLKRLLPLGRDLGRALGAVLVEQNPRAKRALYSLPVKPKKPVQG